MAIAINSNFERDQLVATAGQTIFAYSFPVFQDVYLKVYQRGGAVAPNDFTQKLNLGTQYTVQGVGQETGGTITLTVPAVGGDIITIVGAEPIERESVFQDLNPFTVALNQQLNEQTVMQQQTYTYWANITPHYNFDELISTQSIPNPAGVRPFKLILPMLPDGHTWVGRGDINLVPDDIVTAFLGSGGGNVISTGIPMRQSIANWTGLGAQITDTNINIINNTFTPTVGDPPLGIIGFDDTWGAMHWPAHVTGNRPATPSNGDTYYDTTLNQFFGYDAGVWTPFAMGGSTNTTIFIFVQTPTVDPLTALYLGAAVRMDVASGLWLLTLADNALDAEFYGFIVGISGGGPAFTYTLQLVGIAPVGLPPLTGLQRGSPYYLSDTVPGGIQITPPAGSGKINYPVIWPVDGTTVFIRMSRGFINGATTPVPPGPAIPPVIVVITQGGPPLAVGDWLYISADSFFTRGIATSLATAQVEWVVIAIVIPGNTYVIQQIGQMTGVVTVDDVGAAIVSSTIYYLSRTAAGKLTPIAPVTPGFVSKPLYVQQIAASNTGWIMDQRPEIVAAPSGGGGLTLIARIDVTGLSIVDFGANIFNGTFRDVKIVGENLTIVDNATGTIFSANGIGMRFYTGGVLRIGTLYNAGTDWINTTPPNSLLTMDVGNAFGIPGGTFGTPNSATATAAVNFEIDLYGIIDTVTTKLNYFAVTYFTNVIPGPPPFNPHNVEYWGDYYGDLLPITGVEFSMIPSATSHFTHGTISLYGVATA